LQRPEVLVSCSSIKHLAVLALLLASACADAKPPVPPELGETLANGEVVLDAPDPPPLMCTSPFGEKQPPLNPDLDGDAGPITGIVGGPVEGDSLDGGATDGGVPRFGTGMTRPYLVSSLPSFPSAVRRHHVTGTILAGCVILKDGTAKDCCLFRSLPYAGNAVLTWLKTAQFHPVTLGGTPIDCRVTVPIRISAQ
jgi:TonB-like protein